MTARHEAEVLLDNCNVCLLLVVIPQYGNIQLGISIEQADTSAVLCTVWLPAIILINAC